MPKSSDKNRSQTAGRDSRGRFATGNKLSKGRPAGASCTALKLAREAAEQVGLPLLISEAADGNVDAARALCGFGLPRLKPLSLPCEMPSDVPALLAAMATGQVAVDDVRAALECRLLARKIIESEQIEARLVALEEATNERK